MTDLLAAELVEIGKKNTEVGGTFILLARTGGHPIDNSDERQNLATALREVKTFSRRFSVENELTEVKRRVWEPDVGDGRSNGVPDRFVKNAKKSRRSEAKKNGKSRGPTLYVHIGILRFLDSNGNIY